MNSIPISLNNFMEEGAYIGKLTDFFNEEEIEKMRNIKTELESFFETKKDKVYCRYNFDTDIQYKHSILYNEVVERDNFVKSNNLKVSQKWYEFNGEGEHRDFFLEKSKPILSHLYPDINFADTKGGDFTLYEDGHFIEPHRDGLNKDRVCVLIIYLTDESEYNDGGGELVIKTNSDQEFTIIPVLGTFSVLDFSKNNIIHRVNSVRNGFKRYAFIKFFYSKPTPEISNIKFI